MSREARAPGPLEGLIFAVRRLNAPELDAFHEDAEVRAPGLRIALRRGRNVTTDYGIVERAVPFAHRICRPQISIPLAGAGRAEENGRRVWIERGQLLASDGGAKRRGQMAYSGPELRQLLVEWDPEVFGAPLDRDLDHARISERDCERLESAGARCVSAATAAAGIADLIALLISLGVPFAPLDRAALVASSAASPLSTLHGAMAKELSALDRSPSIQDLASSVEWNERRLHRHIASLSRNYALPWSEWRSTLHAQRMLDAVRLLSAPRATTETVARLTGFRAPTALCHAFANAGLPSPGVLAKAARRDVLGSWRALYPACDPRPALDVVAAE